MTCQAANDRRHCGERVASVWRRGGLRLKRKVVVVRARAGLKLGVGPRLWLSCCRGRASGLGCLCRPRPRLPSDPWVPGPATRPTPGPPQSAADPARTAAPRQPPCPCTANGRRSTSMKRPGPSTPWTGACGLTSAFAWRWAASWRSTTTRWAGQGLGTQLTGSGPLERPFRAGAQTPGPSCGLALAPRSGSSESGLGQRGFRTFS